MGSASRAEDPKPIDFYRLLDNQPIKGLPSQPYNEWTEDQKRESFKAIKLACVRTSVAGVMALAEENSSSAQKEEELHTLTAACVAMHLPTEAPAKKDYQAVAMTHYNAAKALGSTFPPPAF
jgi:hypothetical protein